MSKYKLSEDDVESWAESYGHHSKVTHDAMRAAHEAVVRTLNWSHEASEEEWKADAAQVGGKLLCVLVDAIWIARRSALMTGQIERTITGGGKSKRARAEFERVKNRAVVNQVLSETQKQK